jgi:hypothetical protein
VWKALVIIKETLFHETPFAETSMFVVKHRLQSSHGTFGVQLSMDAGIGTYRVQLERMNPPEGKAQRGPTL